ncbi:MAG: hypothetical protein NWF05_10640 [Candidatus Bathyarchaeota archaeon]|nr:hypothetical protein [Candidatus Bathyarchaeota archaeon]
MTKNGANEKKNSHTHTYTHKNRAINDLEWAEWARIKTEKTLEKMPELKPLQDILLSLGGDWVALQPEPDLEDLVTKGQLIQGKVIFKPMAPCKCHSNCAQLWNKQPKTLRIATGWALSTDGIWRQHTWLLKGKAIIETTKPRSTYYGIILGNKEANNFWWVNSIS